MKLKGRVALVTGGAVRIGRAICEALAAQGCHVIVHYRRSEKEARELVEALRAAGATAGSLQSELGGEQDANALLDEACQLMSRVEILVNNASVFHKDSLAEADEARLMDEWRVNLMAPMFLARSLASRLLNASLDESAGVVGKVINLLDRRVAGIESGCLPYLLSKKGLADFTRLAALELAPHMTVNGVAPGAVLPPPGKGRDYLRDMAGFIPMQDGGTPADIAEAVLYLLRTDVVTGQVIFVDGGQHLCGTQITGGSDGQD